MRGIESSEIGRRTEQLLARVRLQNEAATEATQLSLGEQQRANLARVLATGAPLLLMHEPLVHVDPDLRRDLGTELRAFQEESGATIVVSTRDRDDALRISDRLIVLRDGKVQQDATPRDAYRRPASPEVARLLGDVNIIRGTVTGVSSDSRLTVSTSMGDLSARGQEEIGEAVTLAIRPEGIRVGMAGGRGSLHGVVLRSFYYGSHLLMEVRVADVTLLVRPPASSSTGTEEGASLSLWVDPMECFAIPRRSPPPLRR